MNEYYSQHDKMLVSVDCIVFGMHEGELKILLTRRNFEPEKGSWSLLGGFVEIDESIDDSARRVLFSLTGLRGVFMRQLGAFGRIDRDPGQRVVSIAYYSLVNYAEIDQELIKTHKAEWMNISQLPIMGFDHQDMINKALSDIRMRLMTEGEAINLLPRLFTLSQLQYLYERIVGFVLDKRNFRRKMLDSGFICPTNHIDKLNSKRGARLYTKIERNTDTVLNLAVSDKNNNNA